MRGRRRPRVVLAGQYGADPVPRAWTAEAYWTGTGVGGFAFVALGLLAATGLGVLCSPAHRSGWPAAALVAALPWSILATATTTAPWTASARLEACGAVSLGWLALAGGAAAASTGAAVHLARPLRRG